MNIKSSTQSIAEKIRLADAKVIRVQTEIDRVERELNGKYDYYLIQERNSLLVALDNARKERSAITSNYEQPLVNSIVILK